ncbi:MAG: autotransporter-associated beta strand repeat-containing protein, partial [Opitutales bacterium]|nr:autotransporter-associated beta strand repeat-containing protein [Opitutales bacterium]
NGVFTDLSQKSESGISVKSGTLIFRGTNTVHALGSEDGTNADRLIRANDWHYADAKTSVSVESGATLQLGSHARLSGNVTVRDGGKFVMNEGVHAQNEYIEGGYELENTYAIREFYGLKGDVSLEGKNSAMEVRYNAETTSENLYSGKISGEGSLLLDIGAGSLVLYGENSHTGGTTIVAGTLLADHANALGNGAVTVQSGGEISVGENISLSSAAQSLTFVVGAEQAGGSTGTALVSSSAGVSISVEGATRLYVDVSALLAQRATLENVALKLASDSALKFNDENACVGWWDESSGEWNDLEGYNISFLRDSGEVLLVIPEPSAFGLLAGLGAIALAVSRSRRS